MAKFTSQREAKRKVVKAIESVARTLGNTKTVCRKVQVVENRTCTRDCGHWECQTVQCGTRKVKDCCGNVTCEPVYKSKKVWIKNLVTETKPVTVCKTLSEQVPHTWNVTVCKPVTTTENVTVCKPVTETGVKIPLLENERARKAAVLING